jgi:NTP pyrophosphatase (non-canonical NTP hydrolase)
MKQHDEIMLILQEECAEVTQAVSKVFRFGIDAEYNNATNRQRLTEELGDLLAMITLCHSHGIVDYNQVMIAKDAKLGKLKKWSTIYETENI